MSSMMNLAIFKPTQYKGLYILIQLKRWRPFGYENKSKMPMPIKSGNSEMW